MAGKMCYLLGGKTAVRSFLLLSFVTMILNFKKVTLL